MSSATCPSCGHAVRAEDDFEPIGCLRLEDDHQVCEEQLAAATKLCATLIADWVPVKDQPRLLAEIAKAALV